MGQNLVDSIRIPRMEYKELIVLRARVEILVGMLEKRGALEQFRGYQYFGPGIYQMEVMMRIRILRMIVENFMNYVEKTFDFSDFTSISGRNGIGKSSIATAYNWCLFNCDYDLRDNPVVRREVNGKPVDDVDVAVTLVLDVEGKEVTMRKVQRRTYSKSGDSYKDDNKYFVNDAPKTLKDFNAYLKTDMKTLLMCSNINAFLNQKPAEMREFLFGTVEDVSGIDVAKKKTELSALAVLLERYSADEIEAMNKKVIADVNKELPILDGQIKEKERDIQFKSDVDVAELELKKNALEEDIKRTVEESEKNEKIFESFKKISDEILELKLKQSKLQNENDEIFLKRKGKLNDEILKKKFLISDTKMTIKDTLMGIDASKTTIERHKKHIDLFRKRWTEENNRKVEDLGRFCPYCKREIPDEIRNKHIADFEKEKALKLRKIAVDGDLTKKRLDDEILELARLEKEVKEHNESLEMLESAKSELECKLNQIEDLTDITETAEYKDLQDKIAEKEKQLQNYGDISEYRERIREKEKELRKSLLHCEKTLAFANTEEDEKRLEALKGAKLDAVQKQADAEKVLDMLNELNMAKNDYLSDEINNKFDLVKWKLWELNKSGTYKNVCIPMVDGKSILTTKSNKGNRILGKADICCGIQKITGINAPIWLDDCESLDAENQKNIRNMVDGQLIVLIVNNEEKLKVEGK